MKLSCLILALLFSSQSFALSEDDFVSVSAHRETDPMFHTDDAADDMAIWVNQADRAKSVIIGSDKGGGIGVFTLDGEMKSYSSVGKVNNIDLRQSVRADVRLIDVLAASNITTQTVDLYVYKPGLYSLVKRAAISVPVSKSKVYGVCLGKSASGDKLNVFVTIKTGNMFHYSASWNSQENAFDYELVRTIEFDSTTEGCVVDEENGHLFVAEEEVGIWKVSLEDFTAPKKLIQAVGTPALVPDVEGLALFRMENGEGYLIASSQGNNSYAIFDRNGTHEYKKSFRIADGRGIDGTSKTDGIEVTNFALGPEFPRGAFVAQDNDNVDSRGRLINQNFKIVKWEDIANAGEIILNSDPR